MRKRITETNEEKEANLKPIMTIDETKKPWVTSEIKPDRMDAHQTIAD